MEQIQKQPLLLLISILTEEQKAYLYSKTTFVTVNRISRNKYKLASYKIQKQPLLLLIGTKKEIKELEGKFKNNLCYC